MKTLLCAGWKQSSCDDGPGIRSVFFFKAAAGIVRGVRILALIIRRTEL